MSSSELRTIGDKIAEPFQNRIATAVAEAVRSGRSGAVLGPTGSGKSLLVSFGAEDAVLCKKPVLVLHPDVHLLKQNFSLFMQSDILKDCSFSAFIAQNDQLPAQFVRNCFDQQIAVATNASLVNKISDPSFQAALKRFGKRGGVVLIDEGQNGAADELSSILKTVAQAGGSGIAYTATPFRTDNRDIIEPFGASIEHDLIDVACYGEVLATGRTVPTKFDIATTEFEELIGSEAAHMLEEQFLALLGENKSIDQASKQAFSRFFRPEGSEADKAIGDLIVAAVARIWHRRAPNHKLAMIHCDSVEFARALAAAISQQLLPEGHTRQGLKATVAFVAASEIKLWTDGTCSEKVNGRKARRQDILAAAKEDVYDVLVNVNALGTGTDVPQTDLNILAAQERSIGPVKQNSGRGERSHAPSGKTHQTFVDIGNSVLRIFNDIDAMRRNDPERARRHVRGLPGRIREQFEKWFDTDPGLRSAIEIRTRQIRMRSGASGGDFPVTDRLDPTVEYGAEEALPIPHAFCRGVFATGNSRYDTETKTFTNRLALFIDLAEIGLLPQDRPKNTPQWLTVTHDTKLDIQQAFVTDDLLTARKFAAFVGVRFDDGYERDTPSGAQLRFASNLQTRHSRAQRTFRGYARPVSRTQVSSMIELLNYDGALLGKMLLAGANRFIQRASGAPFINRDLRSVVVHQPNSISQHQRAMLTAYCRIRTELPRIFPGLSRTLGKFSIATYDPSVLPDFQEIIEGTDVSLFVIDTPEKEFRLKDRLANGLLDARIIAMSPGSNAGTWIRRKAGLQVESSPKAAKANRENELAFEQALYAMTGGLDAKRSGMLTIAISRPDCVHIAKSAENEVLAGPMANYVKRMIELASLPPNTSRDESQSAMNIITEAIARQISQVQIQFRISTLIAKFSTLSQPDQKNILKVTTRAAEFDNRRQKYLAETSQLRKTG